MSESNNDQEKLEEPIANSESESEKGLSIKKQIILIIVILLIVVSSIIIILIILNNEDIEDDGTAIYINPKSDYLYCIIWIHGLNNKPENYVDLFTKEIALNKIKNTKIILMRAPKMKMSYGDGVVQTSWFDIYRFPIDSKDTYNFDDAKKSSDSLKKIIEHEAEILGGHYEKIFIGGHSQGACLSLYTGYNLTNLLGGVLACSGVLFPQGTVNANLTKLNVFMAHGQKDQTITFDFHKESIKRIENYEGIDRHYYENYGHEINQVEKKDMEKFLNERIL